MLLLEQEKSDCVIPVVKFSFPPQRCVVINQGRLTPKWPENMKVRSQDLEPFYHDCGQFYWMKDVVPFIQDESTVQDIDTLEDWKIAEMKYQIMHQK